MKALSLQALESLVLVDVPVPTPADHQLLIRTGAATICTSDLNDIKGNPFGIKFPMILGHEAAGTVAGVGARVSGYAVGDRVATHPVESCFACEECRAGRSHLCLNMRHFGLNIPGAFAEYYLVRADCARKISDDTPFTTAALAEPVSSSMQAVVQSKVRPGGSLLIIGDGPFAIIMAKIAVGMGLGHVVIAGRHDFRLAFARNATTVNVKDIADPKAHLASLRPGGFDGVIATVGKIEAVQWGIELLRAKGRLVLFAAMPGQTPIDLFRTHVKELEIVGACGDDDLFNHAIKVLGDATYAIGELVTHRFHGRDYREAFRIAAHQHDAALKVALLWD